MSADDTIFAVSSGSGIAAISIIRVSGSQSRSIVLSLAGRLPRPRTYTSTTITNPQTRDLIDQCVIVWLPGPGSYTGEDAAELFVHGGRASVSSVLEALSSFASCRMAEPGEFTRRAVLNGKMDLVEAEGLGDLLAADTSQQRRQALGIMLGHASSVFEKWRQDLILIRSNIEASLDFADEDGVSESASAQIDGAIRKLLEEMKSELARSSASRAIRDGVKVVLAGLPNTGKSSLLNVLVGHEASIVSSKPGTTRDVIEVRIDLAGIPVRLMDTAGLRDVEDEIEVEGIRRGKSRIADADIVIWVMAPDVEGSDVLWPGVKPQMVVMGKCDHPVSESCDPNVLALSVKTRQGIEEFLAELRNLVTMRFGKTESAVVVSARQQSSVTASIRILNEALTVSLIQLELKADCIARACVEVGRITGKIDVEEWLGSIFSRFCIGK